MGPLPTHAMQIAIHVQQQVQTLKIKLYSQLGRLVVARHVKLAAIERLEADDEPGPDHAPHSILQYSTAT